MVLDSLKHMKDYAGLGMYFKKAIEFLQKTDLKQLPEGDLVVEEDKIYGKVLCTERTQKATTWEVHRKFADIQIIVEGNEVIGYCPLDSVRNPQQYDEEKDLCLFEDLEGIDFDLSEGDVMIFLPQDVHCTGTPSKSGKYVKKIFLKVCLD